MLKWAQPPLIYFLIYHNNYVFTATGCSSERTTAPGTFTSPNYPDNYPNDALCTTLITAPARRSVILVVQDFMLEFNEPGCQTDSDLLAVYDGNSEEAPLIGLYCYNDIPETITSTAESIYIVFKSDGEITARGYDIAYYFLPGRQFLPIFLHFSI